MHLLARRTVAVLVDLVLLLAVEHGGEVEQLAVAGQLEIVQADALVKLDSLGMDKLFGVGSLVP